MVGIAPRLLTNTKLIDDRIANDGDDSPSFLDTLPTIDWIPTHRIKPRPRLLFPKADITPRY